MEDIRKSLVYCMRSGDNLVIYFDKLAPDFKQRFNQPTLPTEKIFKWAEWRKEEVYKSILKEDENFDLLHNKGFFSMKEKFNIGLLSTFTDEESMQEVISKIPHIEEFVICKIE
jgi:hypothetical protein